MLEKEKIKRNSEIQRTTDDFIQNSFKTNSLRSQLYLNAQNEWT